MSSLLVNSSPETLDRCKDIFQTSKLSTSLLMPEAPKWHQGLMVDFGHEIDISHLYKSGHSAYDFHFRNEDLFDLVADFQIVDYINAILTPPKSPAKVTKINNCDPPHNDVLYSKESKWVVTSLSKASEQTRVIPTLYQFREDVRMIISETNWLQIAPHIEEEKAIDSYLGSKFDWLELMIIRSNYSPEKIKNALEYFGSEENDFSFLSKDISDFRNNILTLIPSFSQYIFDNAPEHRKYKKTWDTSNRNVVMHWNDISESLLHSRTGDVNWESENILVGTFITKKLQN